MDSIGHPEADAWHEAGHAVVARLLGGRVVGVTLDSELEDLDGHAAIQWRARDERELASLSGRVALGGPLAELAFRGDQDLEEPDVLAAWEADWDEVERAAAVVEPRPVERVAVIRRWIDEVRALVTDSHVEERIARVADALDAHRSLDEDLFEDCLA
ncbi:MAG: hypothetical protein AAFZ65_09890 [Planctomycetota bacterium]